ncbi:hypothetical protein [Phenylobacterium sp.]|jgi:hypothetical protein|uniref:hypothetical protein n=1 Tax=Phenylobacterium sp. TaxID=1871053 RepID=UPI002F94DC3C
MSKGVILEQISSAGATDDGEMAAVAVVAEGQPVTILVPRPLQATFEAAVSTALRLADDRRRATYQGDANAAVMAPPEMLPTQAWAVLVRRSGDTVDLVLRLELANGLQYNFPLDPAAAREIAVALRDTASAASSGAVDTPTLQ